MGTFVANPMIRDRLRANAARSVRSAADVLVETTHGLLQSGSPDDRSEPGEPPRSQSGELRESYTVLQFEPHQGGARARVGTTLIKGWWLEVGTANMAPRPFARPGFIKARPEMLKQFRGLATP